MINSPRVCIQVQSVYIEAQSSPDNELWIQPLKTRISELDVYESACNEGAGVHDVSRASSLSTAKAQIELVAQEIGIL